MINSENEYTELGKQAGIAMNEKDLGKADEINAQFRELQNQESGLGKSRSQALYNNAYREVRNDRNFK